MDAGKRPGGIVLMTWKVYTCPKRMCSPGINGETELRGQPANPGSPGKMAIKTVCVCVCASTGVEGQRCRGCPKTRWLDCVKNCNDGDNMSLEETFHSAKDRGRWKSMLTLLGHVTVSSRL